MKRFVLSIFLVLAAATMMAEEFRLGKLTFATISDTKVELTKADKSVTQVYINPTVTYNGRTYSVTSVRDYAFEGCSSLTSVNIPSSVTKIGYRAFYGCSRLTSVTIPYSVKEIGGQAFYGCSRLTSITIPSSVRSIGRDAFNGTAFYNNPSNWEDGALYMNNCLLRVGTNVIGDYKIKANTRLIAYGAFYGCSRLTSVTIPNSVTSIGESAFCGCSNLTSGTIHNGVENRAFEVSILFDCTSTETYYERNTVTVGHSIGSRLP